MRLPLILTLRYIDRNKIICIFAIDSKYDCHDIELK